MSFCFNFHAWKNATGKPEKSDSRTLENYSAAFSDLKAIATEQLHKKTETFHAEGDAAPRTPAKTTDPGIPAQKQKDMINSIWQKARAKTSKRKQHTFQTIIIPLQVTQKAKVNGNKDQLQEAGHCIDGHIPTTTQNWSSSNTDRKRKTTNSSGFF